MPTPPRRREPLNPKGIFVNRSAPLSADERQDIADAYRAGKPIRALAIRHRRAYGTIRNALLDAGVTLRSRGGGSRHDILAAAGGDR